MINQAYLNLVLQTVQTTEIKMQIDIQARNFSLTNALREYIQRRLGFALSTRDEYIQRVMVRLSDINGPRGGRDKCCHIQIVLPQLADVVIEDTELDMYVAIDRASDRAGRTVGRKLARQRDNSRTAGLHDPALLAEQYETESATFDQ
jgi:ribosome hibernation promoting factor